jgi:hypothetical protein
LPSAAALPSVFYLALGKAFFAERPKKKHSAKPLALGKRIPVVADDLSPARYRILAMCCPCLFDLIVIFSFFLNFTMLPLSLFLTGFCGENYSQEA